jgi:hypothetical protein
VCLIGWTVEEGVQRSMFQPCLTPGHRTFSEWLWEQVRLSPSDSRAMGVRWASLSQLTVGGDVSTTVTLTASWTG